MFANLVQFDVTPEYRDALVAALLEDGRGSLRDEPGTKRFEVIQDIANPNRIYLYEAYADRTALQAHMQGPHFQQFQATTASWSTGPEAEPARRPFTTALLGRGTTLFPPAPEAAGP